MKTLTSIIFTLLMALALSACAPAQVPATPTLLPDPTATASPSPEATASPTVPPTSEATPTPKATQTPVGSQDAAEPTPFGGGSKIAFSSNRDDNYEIYIMNSDGTNPLRLTDSPTEDWFPQLYFDEKFLLYWSVSKDNPPFARLYWMLVDGSEQGIFADAVGPYSDISSLGLAAFEIYSKDGTRDIVGMAAGGGERTQLTNDPENDIDPDWSPDGKTIAFASYRDGTPHIYLMNWDGTDQRRLTQDDWVELEPDWSPDGAMLVFFSGDDTHTNIYIINSDGTNIRQLTNEGDNYNENPVWSPDGTMIAFWSNRSGNKEIYVMKADGSEVINLTHNPGEDENPSWSR